jgi:protease PrsW
MNLSLLLLTCAPGIAICVYIYWQDKFDKEPKSLLVKSFFLGMLSTIPAILLSMFGELFGFNPVSSVTWWALFSMIVGTGLTEEFSKYFLFVIMPIKKMHLTSLLTE